MKLQHLLLFLAVTYMRCGSRYSGRPTFSDDIMTTSELICDDIEIKNVCGLAVPSSDPTDPNIPSNFFAYKVCNRGQHCIKVAENNQNIGFYQCVNDINLRKVGKKCTLDFECYSHWCDDGKCKRVAKGEKCFDSAEKIDRECDFGLECDYSDGVCVDMLKEGDLSINIGCPGFLGTDPNTGKCAKFGTVKTGKECYQDESAMCETGLCLDTDGTGFKCVDSNKQDNAPWEIFVGGKKVRVKPDSKLKKKLFEKFLKDYNKEDFSKFYKKDKEGKVEYGFDKWQLRLKFLKYDYAEELKTIGWIDEDGDIEIEKKCEFIFTMKNVLGSKFIGLSLFYTLLVSLILF